MSVSQQQTSDATRVEAIRARLAAATPGPWEVDEACSYVGGKRTDVELFVRRPDDDVSIAAEILDPETSDPSQPNAELIANAPADLAWLLARLEEREREIERLRAEVATQMRWASFWADEFEKLGGNVSETAQAGR